MDWVVRALFALEAIFAAAAAFYWYRSASVPIRNDIDNFMDDLQRASELNASGALAACAAATIHVAVLLLQGWRWWQGQP